VSATEIAARQQEWQRRMAPIISRPRSELLAPLIDREFALMFRAKEFADLGEALAAAGATPPGNIDVEYQGPLERAQKAGELGAVQTTYGMAAQIGQVDAEALDVLDHDESLRYIADVVGAPKRIIRDAKTVEKIRGARAAAAAQKQRMEDVAMVAQAAKAGGSAVASLASAEQAGQQNGRPGA
jgi:hypothetical protein